MKPINEDELDLKELEAAKAAADKVVSFFKDEVGPSPSDVDALAEDLGILEPTQVDEAVCAELHMLAERVKALEARSKKLKDFIKTKRDRGSLQFGGYVLTVTERKGRESVDWKAWCRDEIGTDEVPAKYVKQAEPVVVVEVKKLS